MRYPMLCRFLFVLLAVPGIAEITVAQESAPKVNAASSEAHPDMGSSLAEIEIDGVVLFRVIGGPSFPARERAAAIMGRIESVAADSAIKSEQVHTAESELGTYIVAGNTNLMLVTDDD